MKSLHFLNEVIFLRVYLNYVFLKERIMWINGSWHF